MSDSTRTVTRLPCSGSGQAIACLPRAALTAGLAFSGSSSSSQQGGLDANLHVVHATAQGADSSVLSLRSILTPAQVERARRAQAEAAEDAAEAAAASGAAYVPSFPPLPLDSAPVVASHTLVGCGGVSRILCLSDRLLVASTGDGGVSMLEVAQADSDDSNSTQQHQRHVRTLHSHTHGSSKYSDAHALQLRPVHAFTSLHGGATTSLAAQLSSSTPLLASCSDDGSLSLLAPFSRTLLRHLPHAHPSSLYTLAFGGAHTLHAAGQGGTVSSWDLRAGGSGLTKPSSRMFDANAVSITAMAVHPTRAHLLAVGSSNGALSIFDVRRCAAPITVTASVSSFATPPAAPVCSIQATRASVLDVAFVPWAPQQLLACSDDGSLCLFDFAGGQGAGAGADADAAFQSAAAAEHMRPSKIAQSTYGAIRALALDRDTRTLMAAAEAPCLLSCQL